jgi:FtsZ-binding cell division protein ZapB
MRPEDIKPWEEIGKLQSQLADLRLENVRLRDEYEVLQERHEALQKRYEFVKQEKRQLVEALTSAGRLSHPRP